MLNLIVKDTAASVEFYRRLGVEIPPPDEGWHMHAQLPMPDGFSLEPRHRRVGADLAPGWRKDPSSTSVVVAFFFDSREAVDECYAELTDAGYVGRQPPFDAFRGARWAIVADPDGHDVGLMSPMDDAWRSWPPTQSPDA